MMMPLAVRRTARGRHRFTTPEPEMVVFPVIVAFQTGDWLPIAVESYLAQFPADRILVVDNNPGPGETGWSAACRRERRWLYSHPRIDVIHQHANCAGIPARRTHGDGMDLALAWCRSRGADVMLHIEPDCLVTGRRWRENLVGAIEQGAWMAGAHRKAWGPIHPTPSAWLVREVRTSFAEQSLPRSVAHPRFNDLVDLEVLRAAAESDGCWEWAQRRWDTAAMAWFQAAVHDRTSLVDAPGFQHFWLGASSNCLPLEQLVIKFPELASWFARPRAAGGPRRVEDCSFRHDPRRDTDIELACCKLLQQLSGVMEPRLCDVRRDACEACCKSADPSLLTINSTVASLLFRLADRIVDRGGVVGCDAQSAMHLRAFAEEYLELRFQGEGSAPAPRRTASPCLHLGGQVGSRVLVTASGFDRLSVYECKHPDHFETTTPECGGCRDWTDKPLTESVPIEQLVPRPVHRFGRRIQRWAVGVTTAPRPQPTVHACLDSLSRVGWKVPRLFVDSGVTIADRFSELPLTFRETKLGPWPNYYLALVELLMREPEADAFMLVQDDVIFDDRHDVRTYLEEILWPADPIAAVSLYCSKAYTRPVAGWHELNSQWIWGALAFVFPRESAKRFVTDPLVFEHRSNPTEGLVNIDILIGRWAHERQLPIYFPSPSLVQHIGNESSIWSDPDSRAIGDRRADRFAGDIDRAPLEYPAT
jgi:hypothetical protein